MLRADLLPAEGPVDICTAALPSVSSVFDFKSFIFEVDNVVSCSLLLLVRFTAFASLVELPFIVSALHLLAWLRLLFFSV